MFWVAPWVVAVEDAIAVLKDGLGWEGAWLRALGWPL